MITVVSRAEPILRLSAVVLSVAILMIFPALPVPMAIVLALFPVPKLTLPVAPESNVIAETVVEEIVPAPAKVKAVAETEIVSIEATPVKAPPVVTFNPPFEVTAKVPVGLPITTFPVEVPTLVAPDPEEFKLRLVAPVKVKVVADKAEVVPPVAEKLPEV